MWFFRSLYFQSLIVFVDLMINLIFSMRYSQIPMLPQLNRLNFQLTPFLWRCKPNTAKERMKSNPIWTSWFWIFEVRDVVIVNPAVLHFYLKNYNFRRFHQTLKRLLIQTDWSNTPFIDCNLWHCFLAIQIYGDIVSKMLYQTQSDRLYQFRIVIIYSRAAISTRSEIYMSRAMQIIRLWVDESSSSFEFKAIKNFAVNTCCIFVHISWKNLSMHAFGYLILSSKGKKQFFTVGFLWLELDSLKRVDCYCIWKRDEDNSFGQYFIELKSDGLIMRLDEIENE